MPEGLDNPLRKAAVFFRRLESEAADAMLSRLSADEAAALRAAVAELDTAAEAPQPKQKPRRRRLFQAAKRQSDDGGVELQLGGDGAAVDTIGHRPSAAPAQRDPIDTLRGLRDADPRVIAQYLAREQPRAVAAVLACLPADLAAGVLQCLPGEVRAAVVGGLAHAGEADPDSLRVIAAGLSDWIETQQAERRRRSDRLEAIREILAATPGEARRELLDSLATSDPAVAAELADAHPPQPAEQPASPETAPNRLAALAAPKDVLAPTTTETTSSPALSYDELHRLDGRALAEVAATLDARTALLALAAAHDGLLARLASGLPKKTAADLLQRVERLGPTTLAEIDRAQAAFVASAAQVVARRARGRSLSQAEA